jgi:hypothetical protein
MESCIQKASAASSVTIGSCSLTLAGHAVVLGAGAVVGIGVPSGSSDGLGEGSEVTPGLAEGIDCEGVADGDAVLAPHAANRSAAIAMICGRRYLVTFALLLDIDCDGADAVA